MGGTLNDYQHKRDFSRTPEPQGEDTSGEQPIFVVQKHAASRLHYDLRLAIEGVLKSWALPKGPSLDPTQERLAMETEDHPLAYAQFEGVIPADEYGGSSVIVWDQGTYSYEPDDQDEPSIAKAYRAGEIKFRLHGQKLSGRFVLLKTRQQRNSWLLIKQKDEYADSGQDVLSARPESVLSRQTVEEVAADAG